MQPLDTLADDELATATGGFNFQPLETTHGTAPVDPRTLPSGGEPHPYPHFTPEYFQKPITSGSTTAPASLKNRSPVR